ncbi:MAG: Crp/Fnr family transcriptional regulator [Chitinophagales bacterium]
MKAFKRYLQQFPHYKPSVFEEVLPYLSEKHLKPGDFFLQQGRTCRNIAFIEEGLFRVYYLNDGKEITNCFCRENAITCSYTSLITQQASETSIQAIEPSKLIVLSYESIQKLYQKNLFWQQVGRLASENEYIITESHNRFLRDLSATERYLEILENDSDLLQRVPLNYLSTYLQIAPETLSRIRKKIARN